MVIGPDGTIRYLSPSVERVLGYAPEEMLGTNTAEYVHPEDQERAAGKFAALLSKTGVYPEAVETRVRHKDGSWRHLEGNATNLLDDPAVEGLVFSQRDVTDRVRAEEEIRRLKRVLEGRVAERTVRLETALSELQKSEERYRLLVEGAEDYAMFMLTPEGRVSNWNRGAERLFGYGEEEMVGEDAAVLFTPEDRRRGAHENELRLAETEGRAQNERWHLRRDGTRFWASGFVRPVCDEAGVLKGFSKVAHDDTARKKAEDAQSLLAEAGGTLSSSLDYRDTLARVARLAVPRLADWCALDVVAEDGSLERLAVVHQDPEKVRMAYELQERYPSDPDPERGVFKVLRTGESEVMPEIPREVLEGAARDDEHREKIRELGLRSYMVVPLVARGKALGALSFVMAESGRSYGSADLGVAEELARRAALAVDNARLYGLAQEEIEERERVQVELRASRDQMDVILRGVADGVIAQDPAGTLVYANEVAARISGYASVQAMMETPKAGLLQTLEVVDESGRPFPFERLPGQRALRGEEGAEEVLRFRALATGEVRWAAVKSAPVFDERGEVRVAVSIFRDITESRRAEQELARLAAIVASSQDAIISKTLEGTITSWNPGAQKIYGYSAEEAVGRHISMLAPPELSGEIADILRRIRRGERVESYETVRVTKDGRRLDISLTVSPLKDSVGRVEGASTIARDVTERKRAEEAMRQVREAERDRMARDLHDGVLQDLSYTAAAIGVMMLQAEGTKLEGQLQGTIDAIRRAAQGLRDAVYDLRLEQELERPFAELAGSLVEEARRMDPGREISLKVHKGFPDEPLGEAGVELARVIREALTNARRHSGAEYVSVTLGAEGGELVAEVFDDGRGFGPGATAGGGSRSMRERALRIGGELLIEGEPGGGTRVSLRVPLMREVER